MSVSINSSVIWKSKMDKALFIETILDRASVSSVEMSSANSFEVIFSIASLTSFVKF